VHDHPDLAVAADQARQAPGRRAPRPVVVRCDERDVSLRLDPRIEYRDGNARANRSLDGCSQRPLVRRRDGQRVHAADNHAVHDLYLPVVVGLFVGSVPDNVDRVIVSRTIHARMDGNEKQVGSSFGDNADDLLPRPPAPGEQRATTCT
jgi:hypothetical protein